MESSVKVSNIKIRVRCVSRRVISRFGIGSQNAAEKAVPKLRYRFVRSPKATEWKVKMNITEQLLLSFVGGGILCVIAQILIDKTSLTPARILVIYVSAGVLLFAVGLYEPMFKLFGTGVSVPLIGFGANIAKGVRDAIDSEGIMGILTGGLTASAAGISAALLFGFLSSLLFKTGSKRM